MRRALLHMLLAMILCFMLASCSVDMSDVRETVSIAMPAPEGMTDADTNYYKLWLEEQSGLNIELELIPQDYMAEYMRLLFAGNTVSVDAVFFDPNSSTISLQEVIRWGNEGYILPLETMISQENTNISTLIGGFAAYDLYNALTSDDGHIYTMPNLQYSNVLRSAQTMWTNTEWLKQTGMSMPQTTEDYRAILRAFLEADPNKNGKQDEFSVAFSLDSDHQNVVNYLMNSFVYCDPENTYMLVADGEVRFAPIADEWRQGLIYCRELYEEGLLPKACFSFSEAQLVRAVNDPRDLVGGFVSADIANIISQSSPETISAYTHIVPLEGPDGLRHAWVTIGTPAPGGVILSTSRKAEETFALMDLMLGESAYLIAAFGEQNADWKHSGISEVGLSGNAAKITIINQEWTSPLNKNFSTIGPFITYPEYADNVAWSGYQSDQQYLNARAARVYLGYEPDEYIPIQSLSDGLRPIEENIREYDEGALTQGDEGVWSRRFAL